MPPRSSQCHQFGFAYKKIRKNTTFDAALSEMILNNFWHKGECPHLFHGQDNHQRPGPYLIIKTVFHGIGMSIIKIRQSLLCFIFIIGISILFYWDGPHENSHETPRNAYKPSAININEYIQYYIIYENMNPHEGHFCTSSGTVRYFYGNKLLRFMLHWCRVVFGARISIHSTCILNDYVKNFQDLS